MKSTKIQEKDIFSMNVEKEVNNSDLNSQLNGKIFEKVVTTPFTIYGDEEEGYILLLGKYRLTTRKSYEEIQKESTEITWDKIMQVCMAIVKEEILTTKNL